MEEKKDVQQNSRDGHKEWSDLTQEPKEDENINSVRSQD